MDREVIWASAHGIGLEHLRLTQRDQEIVASGLAIGLIQNEPFRIGYEIHCDAAWNVRQISINDLGSRDRRVAFSVDGKGHWLSGTPEVTVTDLDGCFDVDLSITPFTNTLPIRRLGLRPGESREIKVAYFDLPDLTVIPAYQRYTCLERSITGSRYRFEALAGQFVAELPVDAEGLVLDYPDLFKRMWAK